jgi:hypothetical protein
MSSVTYFLITLSSILVTSVNSFTPTNKYLVPQDLPAGPICYDVFNFSLGNQVASTFVLEKYDVGPGTPFPDETVIMSFAQITIFSNTYSSDLSNFNVSLYSADVTGNTPTSEISKAEKLVSEGCAYPPPVWYAGNTFCLITVYFPVPYPRIGPIRPTPDKNQYYLVVTFTGLLNPTQTQIYQWPLLCMTKTGENYQPNNPTVALNGDRYIYRTSGSPSWQQYPADYASGGIWYGLYGPEPSPSATKTNTPTKSSSAFATNSATRSANPTTSAVGSYSATMTPSATSTTTCTPTNSLNITIGANTVSAPDNTPIIAGSITGVLFGLFCSIACFFLARQYRDGVGLFKNKARFGPKQEKDRSLSAKVENQILKLRGVSQPSSSHAAKIPTELDQKSLSSIADAYDLVYGETSSTGPVISESTQDLDRAAALSGALSRSGDDSKTTETTSTNDWPGRGKVTREKKGFGPQQSSSSITVKAGGSTMVSTSDESDAIVSQPTI